MTYRSFAEAVAGSSSSTQVQVTIPAGVASGDVLTLMVLRTGGSTAEYTVTDNDSGTWAQLTPPDGVSVHALQSAGALTVHNRVATGATAGKVITATAGESSPGRWIALLCVNHSVDADTAVVAASTPTSSSSNYVLPQVTPDTGSVSGDLIHFGAAGQSGQPVTWTSSDAVIRNTVFGTTAATGANAHGALATRTFTGDSTTSSGGLTGMTSANRGVVTVAYSAPFSPTLVVDAGTDITTTGGATVTLDGDVSGGDGSGFTYSWDQIAGTTVTLTGGDTATPSFVAPVAGGTFEFELTGGDGTSTDTDVVVVTVTARSLVDLGSTTLASGWSTSTGATDPSVVLEDITADTYLQSPGGSGAAQTVPLGTLPSTVTSTGLVVYLDHGLSDTATTASLTVELMEGATVRGTEVVTPTTTRQRVAVTFTAGECAAITNRANCSLRFTAVTT